MADLEHPSASLEDALKRHLLGSPKVGLGLQINESTQFPEPPPLPKELIGGVLRHGHKLLLAGPPDCGKTSALLSLALCVAHGAPWLELPTSKCNVLFVNLELDSTSFIHRLHSTGKAHNLSPSTKNLAFVNYRGAILDTAQFISELRQILIESKKQGKEYRLVCLDPGYKLVGAGGKDESSNRRVSELISGLGAIAETGDVSFVISVDVANIHPRFQITHELENGIGQLARDADAVLMFWPLEGPSQCYRLKGELREFESFAPRSFSFQFPVFQRAKELDRVAILGAGQEEVMEEGLINLWKVWESFDQASGNPVTLAMLGKKVNLTPYEVRLAVLQAGPHPTNPRLRLRISKGNTVVVEEDE